MQVVQVIHGQKHIPTPTPGDIHNTLLHLIIIQVRVAKRCLIQNLLSYSIHFFFILGGFSGPSGSPGRRPTHPLYNGISGIDGNFRFLIKDR